MELIGKITDVLLKSMNKPSVYLASFFLSLFILGFNFLPEKILSRMKMITFLEDYSYIFVILFLFSFFILLIQLIVYLQGVLKDRRIIKEINNQREKLMVDEDAFGILNYLYEKHPESRALPLNNQKVKLLTNYQMINRVSNYALAYDIANPYFEYVLNPIGEEMLKKVLE